MHLDDIHYLNFCFHWIHLLIIHQDHFHTFLNYKSDHLLKYLILIYILNSDNDCLFYHYDYYSYMKDIMTNLFLNLILHSTHLNMIDLIYKEVIVCSFRKINSMLNVNNYITVNNPKFLLILVKFTCWISLKCFKS